MKNFFNKTFCLEVWGDYACFTRPEMKVERVSYDVITPSAIRAIFSAIFWKPAIRWEPQKAEVLNPIKWVSIRRNEVGYVAGGKSGSVFIEDYRQQRAGLFLRDVKYRIYAKLVFIPPAERMQAQNPLPEFLISDDEKKSAHEKLNEERANENPAKYNAMFERRAKKGQCFFRPYFGCREFSCFFKLVDFENDTAVPIDETRDLGFMLYDMDFTDVKNPVPAFFRARLQNGALEIPRWESSEVRK